MARKNEITVETINNPFLGIQICKNCKSRLEKLKRVRTEYPGGHSITKLLCPSCREVFQLTCE